MNMKLITCFRSLLTLTVCLAGLTINGPGLARKLPDPLPPEKLTVVTPPPATPYRLYVSDPAIGHLVDGRINVYDGSDGRFIGLIPAGFAGQATLSPERDQIFVATTYFSRGSRGTRTDVLEIHDAATLAFKEEIVIPPRHAQALSYTPLLRITPDSRFALVQNATPAVSISVVDLTRKRLASEIATPGCWGIYVAPGRPDRFATLCGDGSMTVYKLDADGQTTGQTQNAKLFDPNVDPLFIHADHMGNTFYFISFKGMVHEVDFSGDDIHVAQPWSLLSTYNKGKDRTRGWRPGGYQISAIHQPGARLFVAMHTGGAEGSHKNPANEIWAFDLETRKAVGRTAGHNAIALAVNQQDKPRVFILDGLKGSVVSLDAERLKPTKLRIDAVGETPVRLELHQ